MMHITKRAAPIDGLHPELAIMQLPDDTLKHPVEVARSALASYELTVQHDWEIDCIGELC